MAEVNIYYHKQTNSWWTNSKLDGFFLRNYISENPVGLGTIEIDTINKFDIKNLHEIHSVIIPDYIKKINGITEEIVENGFKNAIKVSDEQLREILKSL